MVRVTEGDCSTGTLILASWKKANSPVPIFDSKDGSSYRFESPGHLAAKSCDLEVNWAKLSLCQGLMKIVPCGVQCSSGSVFNDDSSGLGVHPCPSPSVARQAPLNFIIPLQITQCCRTHLQNYVQFPRLHTWPSVNWPFSIYWRFPDKHHCFPKPTALYCHSFIWNPT